MIRDRIKELRRVRAGDLLPNPKNWRTHPDSQRSALQAVLAEVGYVDALLARETPAGLMLVDGHLRADLDPAAEVPVLIVDLTDDEADKVLLTFDPLSAMATTNNERLKELLDGVTTGEAALQAMLDGLAKDSGITVETPIVEDAVPEPPVDPVTKPGDLWLLGEHRLLCGNSTKPEDVARLMDGAKADLCFTSPPYAQQRDYDAGQGKVDWDELMRGVFGNLPMADAGQVLVNLGLIHRDGEWVPYWDGWIEWMRSQGWRRFGWYVWDQGSGLPGDWNGRLAPSHEFVFHFNRSTRKPVKSVAKNPNSTPMGSNMRSTGGENKPRSSVCTDRNKIRDSVIRANRNSSHGTGHPATFPVTFASAMLESWPGLTYEPFCGSGTTLIAAEQLHRRCYAMEISPAYCDVAVQRWEKLTGRKATREKRRGRADRPR